MGRLRIYDNGGRTCDRYTILPPRWNRQYRARDRGPHNGLWQAIGSSERPFHPQGFGQHVTAMAGRHLGKRIAWADLPADVRAFARQAFPEYTPNE